MVTTDHPREPLAATARRGRPRSATADTGIIETALRLLEERATTIGALTMEGIAGRARARKAPIYGGGPHLADTSLTTPNTSQLRYSITPKEID